MTLKPSKKAISFRFFSGLFIALFSSLIPVLVFIFILALLTKFGRQVTVQDNQSSLVVYLLSFVVIYILSIIKMYFYVKKSYVSADENGVEVYKSFIGQTKNNVPYINLQSFELNQGLIERLLGLGTIFIYTKSLDENYELSGFDYKEASEFVGKATKEYKLKVK